MASRRPLVRPNLNFSVLEVEPCCCLSYFLHERASCKYKYTACTGDGGPRLQGQSPSTFKLTIVGHSVSHRARYLDADSTMPTLTSRGQPDSPDAAPLWTSLFAFALCSVFLVFFLSRSTLAAVLERFLLSFCPYTPQSVRDCTIYSFFYFLASFQSAERAGCAFLCKSSRSQSYIHSSHSFFPSFPLACVWLQIDTRNTK